MVLVSGFICVDAREAPVLIASFSNYSINGVATTTSGHKKALTRLQDLFQRPIVGINNKSLGE